MYLALRINNYNVMFICFAFNIGFSSVDFFHSKISGFTFCFLSNVHFDLLSHLHSFKTFGCKYSGQKQRAYTCNQAFKFTTSAHKGLTRKEKVCIWNRHVETKKFVFIHIQINNKFQLISHNMRVGIYYNIFKRFTFA